jgi:plasmid stabilization system protein ParE
MAGRTGRRKKGTVPTLVWHPDAVDDFARLHDFLAEANPTAAQRAAKVIKEASIKIMANPALGRPHAEFREWTTKFGRSTYILRYFIASSGDILITRVWHSRELPPS